MEMRRRLAVYFDRKNCINPDELADETLSRVARRLAEEGQIVCETPAKYCYIVARFVFLEYLRNPQNSEIPLEDPVKGPGQDLAARNDSVDTERREKMLSCLEKCAGELKSQDRDLILRYYYGKERAKIDNRRTMAESLGISVNALSIRACRIRDRLEACLKKCANGL